MESNLKKCTSCKKNYDLEHYQKGNRILKLCLNCRNIAKKSKIKTKCIHGRIKYQCKECSGLGFCIHNKRKSQCRDCDGCGFCPHNNHKYDCKECNNPVDITIKRMINKSRKTDIKYNKYDELNFVNYDFLKNLILESNDRCLYCQCELQYIHFNNSLATIERLNNNLGHTIGNCKIACKKCNISKVGSTINPQL